MGILVVFFDLWVWFIRKNPLHTTEHSIREALYLAIHNSHTYKFRCKGMWDVIV